MKKQLIIGFAMVLFSVTLVLAGSVSAVEPDFLTDQETIITGVVQQDGDAFVLQAINGDEYTVSGQDLSKMIGKKVQATGQLVRDKDKNSFNVDSIVEVEEDAAADEEPDLQLPIE